MLISCYACRGIIAFVLLLFLMGSVQPVPGALRLPWSVTATVSRVIDGLTIEVEYQGKQEEVRYLGLQMPEIPPLRPGAVFSRQEAAAANRRLVEGKTVRLEFDTAAQDREAPLLAYVYVGEVMVNAELIRQGVVRVTTNQPRIKHRELLLTLEQEAREAKRGLWGDSPLR
jgi:micrococcal nuclease